MLLICDATAPGRDGGGSAGKVVTQVAPPKAAPLQPDRNPCPSMMRLGRAGDAHLDG